MSIEEAIKLATERAAALTTEKGFKVKPLVLSDGRPEGDVVIGYLKEPSREAKRAILDAIQKTGVSAGGALYLECALLKEESDSRLCSTLPEHDAIIMGAEFACIPEMELYQNEIKKN